MPSNRGVVYAGPGKVEVQAIGMQYNRALMQAILWDRIKIAEVVGVKVISLDEAPQGYAQFDAGAPTKFVIDPHRQLKAA